jgi:RNA polymerase sigma-70 factor (ECF subfamily)
MVSILTRVFGTEHLELAEDVVQQTFLHAIHVWKLKGTPDNPSAWLFRVAKNKAIDSIRRNKYAVQFDFSDGEKQLLNSEYTMAPAMDNLWKEELIKDDLLKMMFACCHPGITEENQITLILKTLCGFSTSEIAKAFLTTEDTISKRLYRTKGFFRENKVELVIPPDNALKQRVRAVLNTVYLLFNEGYNSTQAEQLIREDLMEEAMMLCRILTENKYTRLPEAYALMALMCFHSARSESRITTEGEIILLPQQDRSKWDARLIALGNAYMNEAAFGEEVSPYHIEAAIAYEHCAAKSFEQTNWKRILELYEWLCQAAYSPIAALNKAVAVWQVYGPQQALESLNTLAPEKSIQSYYLYHCLLG